MKNIGEIIKNRPTRADMCVQHGEFKSRNYFGSLWSKCPACVREDDERRKAEEEIAARKAQRLAWEAKVSVADIPERFQARTLDTFEAETPAQKHALEFARDYANNFIQVLKVGRCALFIGRPGTGKTHLAIGIGLHIMNENHTVLFTTVMRAIRRIKDSWAKNSCETESRVVATLTRPDLLILDEVGVQFSSEFERAVLFDALNERYERCRPTVLMSNRSKDELVGFLGERIFDRMREDGGQVVVFDWDSHRKLK